MPSSAATEEIPLNSAAASTSASPALEATFAAALATAREPIWLEQLRRDAWAIANRDGLISATGITVGKSDERWRFSGHKGWTLGGANRVESSYTGQLPDLGIGANSTQIAGRLTFADDQLVGHSSHSADLARKGVIFLPLSEAIAKHPELLREHLFRSDHALGGGKFLALHQAYSRSGAFLYVPDNVEIPETFFAAHWTVSPGATLFPHTLIVAGANSKINFLDYYGSAVNNDSAWIAGAATIIAGSGAKVFRNSVQNLHARALSYQCDTTVCGREADVKNLSVHLVAQRARYESYSKLNGAGANLELDALTIASGTQEFDQRTFQDHAAPRAKSNLLFKNALLNDSRTIFAGMIRVEPNAEETDAYQQNRNLLLNPTAEADSLPGLEIQNQNVRCTHGATTSRLDPEELFYLRSRGVPKNVAYQLLVFGFFEEIIQKVENEALAELLRKLAREKFGN
ncbi:MAG TPA: Fe-S cluster assembly protein SufD [Opitutales bacterium]|nr:Fe-S cluster assembly protein SufD [Opitutales bacterium]